MKKLSMFIAAGALLLMAACSRDLGDYDYKEVPDPVVLKLVDSTFQAMVGDSLIITPEVKLASGKANYSCHWKIMVSDEMRSYEYDGKSLRMVFGLGAKYYPALMILTDSSNGMKYFYNFGIQGNTEFTKGLMVLSSSADKSHFSFVKVDGSLQADLYKAMNGEDLPPNAQQINVMRSLYYNNGAISSYWLTYKTGAVQLDVATLRRTRFLKDFFFGPPESFDNGNFKVLNDGTLMAIINNKIYFGAFETAPFATYFGFLGAPVNGRYNVGPMVLDNMTEAQSYILGYDNTRQAFIRFAGRSYIDTTYTVRDSLFNPKNLKMSLVHMERFTDDDMYAFMDSAGIKIKELYFSVNFNSSDIFRARKARTSPLNGRIKANTVWAKGIEKDFYFSADDKIYRYNPLNDEIRQLATDFGGKTVTMIKVLNNGDLMLVGTEGTVTYLDISTGRNGAFIKKIEGIPGSPKDVAVRE